MAEENNASSASSKTDANAASPATESSTVSLIKSRGQFVTTQLDEDNYLLWKFQVETTVRGHGQESFINGTVSVPARMTIDKDGKLINNKEYIIFQRQDSLLSSWLLSSINTSLLSQIDDCNSSYEI